MKTKLFVCWVALLLLPMVASAVGTTCTNPAVIPPNGKPLEFDYVNSNSSNYYVFTVSANRSYSVEVYQPYDAVPNVANITSTLYEVSNSCTIPMTASTPGTTQLTSIAGVDPAISASVNAYRVSFTTSGSISSPFTVILQVFNGDAALHYIGVKVSETTLFLSGWSSTTGYVTSFSFTNTTNGNISGVLTLFNNATGAITQTSPVNLGPQGAAGALLGTNTTALGIPANIVGYATFTHNGPPGAVLAEGSLTNNNNSGFFEWITFRPAARHE